MFCPKCGEILPEHTRKCPVCGAKLNKQAGRVNSSSNLAAFRSSSPRQYDRTHEDCAREDCTQVNFTCGHVEGTAGAVGLVQACVMFFRKYGDFATRSGRREYWFAMLMLLVGMIFFGSFGLGAPWFFLTLVPWAAATVRRFHDAGLPGLLVLTALIPMVGVLLVMILCTRPSAPDNQWGPRP